MSYQSSCSSSDDQEFDEIVAVRRREENLLKLINETRCEIVQENGQRKLGGPPPNWEGPPPPKGCEIFVGKVPRDVYEDELFGLFSTIGPIYELRLMMDFSGSNRGFAFIQYTNRNDAARAIQELNDHELRPRHKIGVLKSIDNCRLFIGGIPKNKSQEEIKVEMDKLTEGISQVIVYSSITDKTKNRGFAFVEYVNHRAASKARRKLIPDRIQLWGKEIAVDWAEPEGEIEEDIMSKVTVLYVRNLSLTTTESQLKNVFNKASDNDVLKLKMMRDFAFIHFSSRANAERAMKTLNNTKINGTVVEISWARPAKEKKPLPTGNRSKPSSRRSSVVSLPPVSSPTLSNKSLSSSPSSTVIFFNDLFPTGEVGGNSKVPVAPHNSLPRGTKSPESSPSPINNVLLNDFYPNREPGNTPDVSPHNSLPRMSPAVPSPSPTNIFLNGYFPNCELGNSPNVPVASQSYNPLPRVNKSPVTMPSPPSVFRNDLFPNGELGHSPNVPIVTQPNNFMPRMNGCPVMPHGNLSVPPPPLPTTAAAPAAFPVPNQFGFNPPRLLAPTNPFFADLNGNVNYSVINEINKIMMNRNNMQHVYHGGNLNQAPWTESNGIRFFPFGTNLPPFAELIHAPPVNKMNCNQMDRNVNGNFNNGNPFLVVPPYSARVFH